MERYEMDWVLEWCRKKLGKSKFCSVKKIKIRVNNRIQHRGELKKNYSTIYLNLKKHSTDLEIIETIIHEYVHAQQDLVQYYLLKVLNDYNKYFDHPYEKEAESIAKKLSKQCLKELVQQRK